MLIRLFRIICIPSTFCYFRPPDHVISMELLALNFRCQCTQQKLQSICSVLTFDPQHKKILTFSVKDRYLLNYFICIKDFNAQTYIIYHRGEYKIGKFPTPEGMISIVLLTWLAELENDCNLTQGCRRFPYLVLFSVFDFISH